MPDPAIFAVGVFASILCALFFLFSYRELTRLGREGEVRMQKHRAAAGNSSE